MFSHTFLKFQRSYEIEFLLHLMYDFLSFHLVGSLQSFLHNLSRETIFIDFSDAVMHKGIILHHHKSFRRKKTEERLLYRLNARQLRHNLNKFPLVFRQLVFYIERTNGVYFISEEIYTERIFTTVRIDIENTTTHSKLTRFIDIIGLYEFEIAQSMNHIS